jgi:hypothetical protein
MTQEGEERAGRGADNSPSVLGNLPNEMQSEYTYLYRKTIYWTTMNKFVK